eukprot:349632-Chlamydomonas_euryale.AAC.62
MPQAACSLTCSPERPSPPASRNSSSARDPGAQCRQAQARAESGHWPGPRPRPASHVCRAAGVLDGHCRVTGQRRLNVRAQLARQPSACRASVGAPHPPLPAPCQAMRRPASHAWRFGPPLRHAPPRTCRLQLIRRQVKVGQRCGLAAQRVLQAYGCVFLLEHNHLWPKHIQEVAAKLAAKHSNWRCHGKLVLVCAHSMAAARSRRFAHLLATKDRTHPESANVSKYARWTHAEIPGS